MSIVQISFDNGSIILRSRSREFHYSYTELDQEILQCPDIQHIHHRDHKLCPFILKIRKDLHQK